MGAPDDLLPQEAATRNIGEKLLFGLDFSGIDWSSIQVEAAASTSQGEKPKEYSEKDQSVQLQSCIKRLLSMKHPSLEPSIVSRSKDDNLQRLFAWATESQGAFLDGICTGKDAHGGSGLFATRSVSARGTVLASLPRSLRMGQKMACQRLPGLPSNTPDLSATSLLVLSCLAEALDHPDGSHYGLYALSLPTLSSEFVNAIYMSDEERNAWAKKGESYHKELQNVRDMANCCVYYIQTVLLNEVNETHTSTISKDSAIYWAIAMVLSRSHGFGSRTGGRWLTPIFDLANHSPCANCELEGDDQGRLLLKAKRPLQCGEEVTIDYQVYDDAKLLATYGFSLKEQMQ